jgi:Fe-S cluster biogenesis protein NfuA
MALAIAPIVSKMNFDQADCFDYQLEAMTAIRNCCDFIANNVGTNKIMDPLRKVTGTVGKISIKGQGSCHGCSSLIASYLYFFRHLLGIDIKYRSGYSFHAISGDKIHPTMDKH